MAIIKLMSLETKTELVNGEYQIIVTSQGPVLFNTNEMILANDTKDTGGAYIQYKRALIGTMYTKENIEEIMNLINKAK